MKGLYKEASGEKQTKSASSRKILAKLGSTINSKNEGGVQNGEINKRESRLLRRARAKARTKRPR